MLTAVFALGATAAVVLRGDEAFFAAAGFLRAGAVFFLATCRLRVFEAFFAAARDFRVFPAFFAADFLETDFDAAMFAPLRRRFDQTLTCCSMNSTMCPNMGPHFAKSGEEPALRSMSTYSSAIEPPALR